VVWWLMHGVVVVEDEENKRLREIFQLRMCACVYVMIISAY